MGWLWSSSPAPSSGGPPGAESSHATTAPTTTTSPTSTSTSHDDDSQLDPDERELKKLFALIQEDSVSTKAAPTDAQPAKPSLLSNLKPSWLSSPSASADADANAETSSFIDRERSLAEAVLPTSMSCQQAFDLAWGCQSPVGQWRAVYRHGNVRPCSDLWEDFWFCMRVKSFSPGLAKDEAIRSHFRKREMEKYYTPSSRSSEDVWRSRTIDEVLPPDAVFNKSFKAVLSGGSSSAPDGTNTDPSTKPPASEQRDAEQIRADLERRRLIRQQMGYEK
ncbi:hypothetical protein CMQ_3991 [Grosmannia clavigera kw1407]|uniref:Early meiotic induction protein 1 n=1 Tax=Grosmannia clavigera (strain kw1407 / UAMH 11150) TaxID=655863 RepID=F0XA24_GROCL|nr:uncharacterized protein CMQ_3991 [Grosmannia clavigera kw1407]EFX05922.1 hypothetical protein CMQ_3991 [Grosmannia clavigera kw1407]